MQSDCRSVGEYTVETYKLNRETSAFHNWVKLGAPKYPTQEQIEYLKAISRPQQETGTVRRICSGMEASAFRDGDAETEKKVRSVKHLQCINFLHGI